MTNTADQITAKYADMVGSFADRAAAAKAGRITVGSSVTLKGIDYPVVGIVRQMFDEVAIAEVVFADSGADDYNLADLVIVSHR